MWYEKQFRDNGNLTTLLQAIRQIATFPIRIMEVCGGQTYALSRYRIEELLPDTVQMIHGPGCPVCVTHEDTISQAIEIARNPQTIFCTFGDMVRVPGTKGSLQQLKAEGKDIRIVYSPLDTLRIASENPEKQVVFFAIGFETTTPLYTLLLQEIVSRKITNLSLLTSLFTIPAAISFLAQDPECKMLDYRAPRVRCFGQKIGIAHRRNRIRTGRLIIWHLSSYTVESTRYRPYHKRLPKSRTYTREQNGPTKDRTFLPTL